MHGRALITIAGVLLISACTSTPQPPVPIDLAAVNQSETVALVFAPVPESTLTLPGASCLLCVAVAASANSGLSKVVKTYSVSDIEELEPLLVEKLEGSGAKVISVNDLDISKLPKFSSKELGFAKRDLREVAASHDADHVLVVDLVHVGVTRPYASYVPTGAPYANITGVAYAVDRKDNSYAWYEPIDYQMQAEGEWKEDPGYHNVTNAYYRLVEKLRDRLLSALTQSDLSVDSETQPEIEPLSETVPDDLEGASEAKALDSD